MRKQKTKTKRKNFNNYFIESWDFIKQNKKYIYFATAIFIFFVFIGYFISPAPDIEKQLLERISQIMERFNGLSMPQTIWTIFTNNLSASFFAILLGVLFGIFPLITAIVNGYILGFVANKAVSQEGVFILWRVLPHGIFELPAVLISIGIGLSIGLNIFKPNLKEKLSKSIKAFALIILPLLLIAAIIEGALVFLVK